LAIRIPSERDLSEDGRRSSLNRPRLRPSPSLQISSEGSLKSIARVDDGPAVLDIEDDRCDENPHRSPSRSPSQQYRCLDGCSRSYSSSDRPPHSSNRRSPDHIRGQITHLGLAFFLQNI